MLSVESLLIVLRSELLRRVLVCLKLNAYMWHVTDASILQQHSLAPTRFSEHHHQHTARMSAPITLWNPNPVRTSDDSGVLIVKTILPKAVDRAGAYDSTPSRPLPYVPPLEHFCLKVLSQFPEQVHVAGPHKLRYSRTRSKIDVFRSLFPAWETCNFSLREIDPRLWATIVQLYSNIPEVLSSYLIALEDPHLPVLQSIPSTQHFALITTLDLRNCQDLTDESVLALKVLDHLCALDATNTQIGSHGIKLLSRALRFNDHGERRGPWGLRILRLRKCRNIDKELFKYLNNFPLLCAVGTFNQYTGS